ncbi:MAG TPA: DUF5916 domain-containing protein [Gemmatimonadales bacterium]|nr:DUF5916 domain-containing protein [Gemmatimonadales bacterium]
MTPLLGLLLVVQAYATTPSPPPSPSTPAKAPPGAPPAAPPGAPPTAVRATRAAAPPTLDGRDDDPVWRTAPAVDGFLEARPSEGAPPKLRTEVRIAYDEHNLYAFVRAWDPHPDSIVTLLARRDVQPPSDYVTLMLDPYHDRRTGYEFSVNPAGVKADYAIYNDGTEDVAWDAVWDVATRIDSTGWTAEYRIPLSQLHYTPKGTATFGILVWRVIQRYTETVTWPLYRSSRSGLPSQFAELTGLEGLASPGHAELTPYVVTKNVQGPASAAYARDQQLTVGGDLKYAFTSNVLLNATVNPDFGQVEADPSVLNLSAFETFFTEQRPFFVEGKGLFEFPVNCVVVHDCNTGEGLFYSRRIGRAPQLADTYGDDASPAATRILGAAKVTGRLPNGFSLGVLDAVTDNVAGPGATTLEPTTNYVVARGNQDLGNGNTSLGFIATAVNRSLDPSSEPYLRRSAYTGGLDARHRFAGQRFEVSGSFDVSRVAGSAAAIARTQRDPVHLYQRPDAGYGYDSTRTSLGGTNLELRFAKVGGQRLKFETAYQRRSPGFEINDVGFLLQADQQQWTTWARLDWRTPNRIFQQLGWNFNHWEYWTAGGLPTERAFNTNTHIQFTNRWWLHAGGTVGQLGTTYCDRCARGGPAIRQDPYVAPWAGIQGDDRKALVPSFWVNYWRGDAGHSEDINLQPELDLKVSSRFTTSLAATWDHNRNGIQYFGTFADAAGGQHYTFAHLNQHTLSLTWRLGYTFTPTTSLQIYASPFISKGTYGDVREIAAPRAAAFADRYRPYTDSAVAAQPAGFNVQQFRSNVVFRWEYRPGSTLFLVWSEGREGSADVEGRKSFGGDLGDLFRRRANDVFLVKVSYWLAR